MKSNKVYKVRTNFFDANEKEEIDNFSSYNLIAIDAEDAIIKAKSLMVENEYVGSVECICWLDKKE